MLRLELGGDGVMESESAAGSGAGRVSSAMGMEGMYTGGA